jgi:predicted esterase
MARSDPPVAHRKEVRILCCHGYASNGSTFVQVKAKALAKAHADDLELCGVDGPSVLEGGRGKQRAWWTFDPPFPLTDRTLQSSWWARDSVQYDGVDTAVETLVSAWNDPNSSYDGILGFSQGALAAAMVCARLEQLQGSVRPRPRFVILCCGFRRPFPSNPGLRWWRELGNMTLQTPALIVAGAADQACPVWQSEGLASLFSRSTLHIIPGGAHAMPKDTTDLARIATFAVQATRRGYVQQPAARRFVEQSATECEPCEDLESGGLAEVAREDGARRVCKAWARGSGCDQRGCPFRHSVVPGGREERRAERARRQREQATQPAADDPHAGGPDGKASHGARHAEFARWLLSVFGAEVLGAAHGVLDVAGGRAGLSFELHVRQRVTCTLLEVRESVLLKSHQRRALAKLSKASDGVPPIPHVHAMLDESFMGSAEGAALLAGSSALVGMHPDEATEPIVRAALRFNKPFAVVPCCVFPSANSGRRLHSGEPVETYEAFCQFLLELAPGSEWGFLPFLGRNRVIYRRPAGRQAPQQLPTARAWSVCRAQSIPTLGEGGLQERPPVRVQAELKLLTETDQYAARATSTQPPLSEVAGLTQAPTNHRAASTRRNPATGRSSSIHACIESSETTSLRVSFRLRLL